MGQDVRSQLGFSIGVMTVMMRRLELLWNESLPGDEKDDVLGAMAYSVISYCNALRGNAGFKMDLGACVSTCSGVSLLGLLLIVLLPCSVDSRGRMVKCIICCLWPQ
jgi:hypothetical protein